jgi:hypothetical protein
MNETASRKHWEFEFAPKKGPVKEKANKKIMLFLHFRLAYSWTNTYK